VLLGKFIAEFLFIPNGMKSKVLCFDKEKSLSRIEIFTYFWKIFPSNIPEAHRTKLEYYL